MGVEVKGAPTRGLGRVAVLQQQRQLWTAWCRCRTQASSRGAPASLRVPLSVYGYDLALAQGEPLLPDTNNNINDDVMVDDGRRTATGGEAEEGEGGDGDEGEEESWAGRTKWRVWRSPG